MVRFQNQFKYNFSASFIFWYNITAKFSQLLFIFFFLHTLKSLYYVQNGTFL